ncbi:MAG: TCP-1/cpn60 chaperonin family protein [archaeon]|jgi:thermosome|nr:TCP-1/cpn60 chaperonin family protein [archaeon]
MSDKQPVYIMPENVSRTLGRDAQRNNILAAKVVADIVKTTLGPKGMDKMLVDATGNIIVTNDGVTILEEMEIEHPAAKMMVEVAKTQETEVGDGTTTAAVLGGKLLENAEKLLDRKIHPTVIVRGYRLAAEKSIEILNEIAIPVDSKKTLRNIAMTAMTGKGAEGHKEKLAELIVNSVDEIATGKNLSLDGIKIQKLKGDGVVDSEMIKGMVIDKERANMQMPPVIKEAKILLTDAALELKNPETEAKISVSTPEQLESFLVSEERHLKEMTDKIISSGANVVFCQKGIDDVAQYYLAKAGIYAVRRVPRSDMEQIARATSGVIVSNLKDITPEQFGYSQIVEEEKRGDEALTYIRGCKNPRAVTIVIRGGTSHVIDEIERAIKDGLGDVVSAVNSGKVVAGGGAVEIELARRLRAFGRTIGGREQLAIEEFSNSLEAIPESLAENAGFDPIDIIAELRKTHEGGNVNHGLNLFNSNSIEDTFAAGIVEPLKVKTQAISSASEFATMILRIDDVLVSSSKSRPNMPSNPYMGMD